MQADTSPYETVHRVLTEFGGAIVIDKIDRQDIRSLLKFHQEWAQRWIDNHRHHDTIPGSMPHVYFGFIDSTELNALATLGTSSEEVIGINWGTPALLDITFLRLMADPAFMPEVGDSSKETNPIREGDFAIDMWDVSGTPVCPIDHARMRKSAELTDYAMRFLVAHELAHLRHGHVHYWSKKSGQPFISERSFSFSSDPQGMISQALEFDADNFGGTGLVHLILSRHRATEDVLKPGITAVEERALKDALLAVYTLFRLFEGEDEDLDFTAVHTLSHPPHRTRQMIACGAMSKALEVWCGLPPESAAPWLAEIVGPLENAWVRQTGRRLRKEAVLPAYSSEGVGHVHALMDQWTALRPDLLPFSRTDLAP